jgi:AcrR family transcriptional regulator
VTAGETLTEPKRRRTRRAIADAAQRLFLERGFEAVTVAQVAAAAEVAEKTVYNHFRTKAELVSDADDRVLARLLTAIRARAVGRSAVAAVRTSLTASAADLGAGAAPEARAAFRRLVAGSPTLQAHQRALAARYERALAAALTEETGVDPGAAEPFLAAAGLVAALRAGFETAPRSGGRAEATDRALDLLETGLARYAVRTASAPR